MRSRSRSRWTSPNGYEFDPSADEFRAIRAWMRWFFQALAPAVPLWRGFEERQGWNHVWELGRPDGRSVRVLVAEGLVPQTVGHLPRLLDHLVELTRAPSIEEGAGIWIAGVDDFRELG